MRDYKKGKNLLESRPGQLLPFNSKDSQAFGNNEQQQKRILDKVWASVEKAMSEMKNVLLSQLQDPNRTLEDQEKTIEHVARQREKIELMIRSLRVLLELQAVDDPIWTYFDSQHKYILAEMNKTHRSSVASIQGMLLLCPTSTFLLTFRSSAGQSFRESGRFRELQDANGFTTTESDDGSRNETS